MKAGKAYCVSYRSIHDDYIEIYVFVTERTKEAVHYKVTEVISDSAKLEFSAFMKWNTELKWSNETVRNLFTTELTPKMLKLKGRCPVCSRKGVFIRADLCCPEHGAWAGIG